jgi:hypothetical protein
MSRCSTGREVNGFSVGSRLCCLSGDQRAGDRLVIAQGAVVLMSSRDNDMLGETVVQLNCSR